MLSSRSLFRVDRLLKFSSNYVKSRPPNCSQGHYYYNFSCNQRMGGARHKAGPMGRTMKQKTFNPVWRPVCTQASVSEVDVLIESEDGSQIQEVQCRISTDVSDPDNVTTVAEVANEVTDSNCSSGTLYGKAEERALEGESVPSAGKHSRAVEIGASIIRFITGKDGSLQKKIEEEMGVKIIIPSSKKEDTIIVEGDSSESITKATERIQATIDEAVKSPQLDYSHFVSLPLAIHPELVDKLVHFQNSILGIDDASVAEIVDGDSNEETFDREDKDEQLGNIPRVVVELKARDENDDVKVDITSIPLVRYAPKASSSSSLTDLGIDKSIFIKPKTFHLTVLMLKLWNKERVSAAAEVLKNISSKVMDALDNRPVFIRLKGLDCMRGSLAKARVLYTPVEEIGDGDRLMRACQVIIDAFNAAGLVLEKDSKQKLKLHATVMNVRHRKRVLIYDTIGSYRKKWTKKFDSFDARGIFKQFGSEDWGEYLIREAHLSQRFMFDENGYYHCCASIPFPKNMQVD